MKISNGVLGVALMLSVSCVWAGAGESKCGGLAPSGTDTGGAYFNNDLPAGQDVFSFCAFGYPPHCWVGVEPISGTWEIVNQYCFNSKWTQKYEEVCPKAKSIGTWKAQGKMPFSYKGKAGAPDGLEQCDHLMEQ
ncbi:hypothetical protein LPB72_10575 [Hydrogenophaga crassostreae]|uniref:Chitin-binding type-2 domain-containing protein n=1 Tax=Hydrogenophaga crassostreae TaxID=1763535 RepID=A0A162SYQ8_9BURK|nr:hypothetical protein [Hydrogenophaga crassostreae]AOW13460.1 hypothetical protein LPB072_11950 [Hydrogenophaga crassostreae]OAD41751.1 hypothetical protein LPB72_10575 [Hydrogenophaga crassostreae]